MTASSALRPFHDVNWWAGAPENVYFTPSMFMQHVPKPAAGRDVCADEWLRTITSMPSKACARCMSVFALGGIISSPGVPNTVTLPGVCDRAPEAAEAGLNRIGNTASGRAIGVATAESPPVLVPFLRPVAFGHPRTVEDTHADGGDGNRPPHNPGHAFCCGDGRVGAAPLLVLSLIHI